MDNCDKHIISQLKEVCQLLSTAHRVLDGVYSVGLSKTGRKQRQYIHNQSLLYKATHINHPSAVYCRDSLEQYMWAAAHLRALCNEYTFRYGKVHKADREGLVDWLLDNVPKNIGIKSTFDLPYPAMPPKYLTTDVVESYRNYYRGAKRDIATWSGKVNSRPIPDWFI